MRDPVLASLLRINRQRMRHLRAHLSPYHYVGCMHLILLYTGRNPGASQEDIAGFYAVDKTSVARDARRLEDMGHIRREIPPNNRRQYQIFLTGAGEEMLVELNRIYDCFQERLFRDIAEPERETLRTLLARLEQNCQEA